MSADRRPVHLSERFESTPMRRCQLWQVRWRTSSQGASRSTHSFASMVRGAGQRHVPDEQMQVNTHSVAAEGVELGGLTVSAPWISLRALAPAGDERKLCAAKPGVSFARSSTGRQPGPGTQHSCELCIGVAGKLCIATHTRRSVHRNDCRKAVVADRLTKDCDSVELTSRNATEGTFRTGVPAHTDCPGAIDQVLPPYTPHSWTRRF